MEAIPQEDSLHQVLVNLKDAVAFKDFKSVQINVLEAKLCDLRKVDLKSIVDEFNNMPYLLLVRLLDKNLCCLCKFFLRPFN